jgi:hypothetical protein
LKGQPSPHISRTEASRAGQAESSAKTAGERVGAARLVVAGEAVSFARPVDAGARCFCAARGSTEVICSKSSNAELRGKLGRCSSNSSPSPHSGMVWAAHHSGVVHSRTPVKPSRRCLSPMPPTVETSPAPDGRDVPYHRRSSCVLSRSRGRARPLRLHLAGRRRCQIGGI